RVHAQRRVALTAAQKDVGQRQRLELLNLRMEGDGLVHQLLGAIEITAEVRERKSDAFARGGIVRCLISRDRLFEPTQKFERLGAMKCVVARGGRGVRVTMQLDQLLRGG